MTYERRTEVAENLKKQFFEVIESAPVEQVLQELMERNTQLIPREFVQNHGIHFDLVLRKIGFGADYKTDFFYMSKSSDDWNLVFIEIEKPSSRFFKEGSNDFHPNFIDALQQISRWRAWLSEPSNLAAFLVSISSIHLPAAMRRNPCYPKFVLVHGRRNEYSGSDIRRSLVRSQERDDFRIMSFDSLAENLANKHVCYVGARRNELIEIFNDKVISPDIFGWIEPTEFLVSSALRDDLRQQGDRGPEIRRMGDNEIVDALKWVSEKIRVRN